MNYFLTDYLQRRSIPDLWDTLVGKLICMHFCSMTYTRAEYEILELCKFNIFVRNQ